MAKNPVDVTCV